MWSAPKNTGSDLYFNIIKENLLFVKLKNLSELKIFYNNNFLYYNNKYTIINIQFKFQFI